MSVEVMTALMGVNFRGKEAIERVKELVIGETLTLQAEPTNAYDVNAVQVWTTDEEPMFIGYMSKECNLETSQHLQAGGQADCEVISFLAATKPHLSVMLLDDEDVSAD